MRILSIILSVFSLLNLSSPELEKVDSAVKAGNEKLAAELLLDYYRNRTEVKCPYLDVSADPISADEQKWADDALEHKFFVHAAYPSYFYGEDIDWTFWPVKDNELRWQLHRTKWWIPLGKAYRDSGDEKYAREWTAEYLDWMRKNPLTEQARDKDGDMSEADNVFFAWRPLEVSDRLLRQITQFKLFLNSPCFTPDFLLAFLENYNRHAAYLSAHYTAKGNHLLFEAMRMLGASVFFHEFAAAPAWKAQAIDILNREVKRQVYEDGVQNELDPHYHLECIDIFFKALALCDANGLRSEFPESYIETIHKMIQVSCNMMYPDGLLPLFSDCRFSDAARIPKLCANWSEVFPEDAYLRYLASAGAEGSLPEHLSKAFPHGGFYVLRTGWDKDATVVDIKAGPKGEWHCQPDNGTFEYWHKGRNFFPDSGSYIYGGDAEVMRQRNWFRQTRVHNTVTLEDRTYDVRDSRMEKWDDKGSVTIVNEPYEGFVHRRSFTLLPDGSLRIRDELSGSASGRVQVHFNLLPCELECSEMGSVRTCFEDGKNIPISTSASAPATMKFYEGWTSPVYKEKIQRPSYAVTAFKKAGRKLVFDTLITPVN